MTNYKKKILDLYKLSDLITESALICIIIILIDKLNLITLCINSNLIFPVLLFIACCFIKFINKPNLNKFVNNGISELDKVLVVFLFLQLLFICYTIVIDLRLFRITLLIITFFTNLIILFIRSRKIKYEYEQIPNVLDLRDIIKKEVDLKDYNDLILIDENEVDYDLLKRKGIINNLLHVITRSSSSKSFTIGLNGKWGSGKTTIINNVLAKIYNDSHYSIIKFDPWMFNSDEAMLEAFLKDIIEKTDFNISISNRNEIIHDVISSIFPSKYHPLLKYVTKEFKCHKENLNITKIVNNYLKNNNKKMIIIIDNLDRIDGKKAIFLIKCLDTVLNFENTINILLYDEEIINEALKREFHFNEKYMEKLVQLKIDVPVIDKYTINDIKTSVLSNLKYNGKRIIDYRDDEVYEFDNLRELKRFLNSIILLTVDTNDTLNSKDSEHLKFIRLKCPELYYEIWNNKKYYILYDRKYDPEIYTFDYDRLNKEAKEYFEKLYKNDKYKEYLRYAEEIFPNMKNSKTSFDIFSYHIDESSYSDSVLNNRASNTRYFDLYFTDEENDFVRIKNDAKNIVKIINESNDYYNELEKTIKKYNPDELKVFWEIFDLYLDKIPNEKSFQLTTILIDAFSYTKDRLLFFELDSKQRLYIIISRLMSKISTSEYEKFKKLFEKNYKSLSLLSNLKYWIENNKKKGIKYNFDFDIFYNELCQNIFNKKINIYSLKYYKKNNIWALYRFNRNLTIEYVKEIINKKNVYLVLNDLVSSASGDGSYRYYISDDNIKNLIPEIDIKPLLKKKSLTEKEKLIYEIYEASINETDEFEKGITKNYYIEF